MPHLALIGEEGWYTQPNISKLGQNHGFSPCGEQYMPIKVNFVVKEKHEPCKLVLVKWFWSWGGGRGVEICSLPLTWPNQWRNSQVNGKVQILTPECSETA